MWPEPDDGRLMRRMRSAHARACEAFDVTPSPEAPDVWGWHGRSIAAEVASTNGLAWLKVTQSRKGQIIDTFWTGAVQAHQHIPPSVPRPRLRRWQDWTNSRWAYRAELYDHANAGTVSDSAIITSPPSLPANWWAEVRAALAAIATVRTQRHTIQPGFLTWAMPHYLGISHTDCAGIPWTAAHGDFHFANLCAPHLTILDWEGWGLAPPGYDAATLHTYSLLTPKTAVQISRELGNLLTTSAGRYAQLAVITDLLHGAVEGINPELAGALRQRAATILGPATTDNRHHD
jgi:hypothetical protein